MNKTNSNWLLIAFVACFLAIGIPYWQIPYSQLSLPDALIGFGLLADAIAAATLQFYRIASFWQVVRVMMMSVVTVVIARVIVDAVQDPTSHNLWPLEIAIALLVGFICALGGAAIGRLTGKLLAAQTESEKS